MADKNKRIHLKNIIPFLVSDGWTETALVNYAHQESIDLAELKILFPDGIDDLLNAIHHQTNLEMLKKIEKTDLSTLRLPEKITFAVMTRFTLMAPYQQAFERHQLQLIKKLPLLTKAGAKTVDLIWQAIGDHPTDFSFYTKRLSLGAILTPTTRYWLTDQSPDFIHTRMFFERRLDNLALIPKTKAKIKNCFTNLISFAKYK